MQRFAEVIPKLYETAGQRLSRHRWLIGAVVVAGLAAAGYLGYQRVFPTPEPPEAMFERAWRDGQRALHDHEAAMKLQLIKTMVGTQGARGEALALVDSVSRTLRASYLARPGGALAWTELDALLDQLTLQVGNGSPAALETVDAILAALAGRPEGAASR
jgi:hypothetical protein